MIPEYHRLRRTRRTAGGMTLLLLMALLNVSLHIYSHFGDSFSDNHTQQLVSRDEDSSQNTRANYGNGMSCVGCQTLHEFQADARTETAPIMAGSFALILPAITPSVSADLALAHAGRAPPVL